MSSNHWIWEERLEHQVRKGSSPEPCKSVAFRPVVWNGTQKRQSHWWPEVPSTSGQVLWLGQHSKLIGWSVGTMIPMKLNLWPYVWTTLDNVPVHVGIMCVSWKSVLHVCQIYWHCCVVPVLHLLIFVWFYPLSRVGYWSLQLFYLFKFVNFCFMYFDDLLLGI